MPETTEEIRRLNDALRATFTGGKILITSGVQALGEEAKPGILILVQNYTKFTEDNDPHGEHDFGSFEFEKQKLFWKIDYYDKTCVYGSPDPSDPSQTTRVLTILLASEY
jgi:hypothetical protein